MNTCKVVKKPGRSQIVYKSRKGQQLSEREAYGINNDEVKGLLRFDLVRKGATFELVYDVTGYVSFAEYLRFPLNKETFARVLQDVFTTLKSIEDAFFHQKCILMDFDLVMVNPATQSIHFVYVPIQGFEGEVSLREFLLNIIRHASFEQSEETDYVKEYITILNNGINFSAFDLEEYILSLLDKKTDAKTECPRCKAKLQKGTYYCPACGMKITGGSDSSGDGEYDPTKGDDLDTPPDPPPETRPIGPRTPFLLREKSGEKIMINKPTFRMGRGIGNDYVISDNSAISGNHADIIAWEQRYFVYDHGSTNKTYVNGQAIPAENAVEIVSGTVLRLANENFTFYLES